MLRRKTRLQLLGLLLVGAMIGGWLYFLGAPAGSRTRDVATVSAWKTPPETPSIDKTATTEDDEPEEAGMAASGDKAGDTEAVGIDEILTDPKLDNEGAAKALGTMVLNTALDSGTRAEALTHMQNLSTGNERALLLPLFKSSQLTDEMSRSILYNSLNGSFGWQADVCLAILTRTSAQDLRTEAIEHLKFLTDQDYGVDIKSWTLAVDKLRPDWESE